MDHELSCNFLKCRRRLTGFAWVTSCSHIFCDDDGNREFSKAYKCPACSSQLTGQCDIVRVDLAPSEQYKSMILTGLKPDVVIEVAQRAVSFWNYQMFQEHAYQEHSCEKYKKKIYEAQQYLHDMKTKYTSELQGYKLKLEEVQNKVVEMEGTLHQKEAQVNDLTRRFRNQQYMFNELKMKSNNLSATSLSRKDKENAPDLGAGPATRPSQPLPQAMPGTPMQLMSARGKSLPASQVYNLTNKARMQSFAFPGANFAIPDNSKWTAKVPKYPNSAVSALGLRSSYERASIPNGFSAQNHMSASPRRPITPAAPNLPSRPQTPSLGRALAARREQKKTNSMT